MKKCNKCLEVKEDIDFYNRESICKSCRKEQIKIYKLNNKDKIKQYRQKNSDKIKQYYLDNLDKIKQYEFKNRSLRLKNKRISYHKCKILGSYSDVFYENYCCNILTSLKIKFRREVTFNNNINFFYDILLEDYNLVIEINEDHHNCQKVKERDNIKYKVLSDLNIDLLIIKVKRKEREKSFDIINKSIKSLKLV